MLPAVPDAELEKALDKVVTAGWRLPEQPARRQLLEPLLYLASAQSSEPYPTGATRVLRLLDESFRNNADEALGSGEEPILTNAASTGLRILYGTHPDYRDVGVDTRRKEAAALLFPERKTNLKPNSIYKTWQKPAHRLAIECLRASYGQEATPHSRRHESVRRTSWAVVGEEHRQHLVESSHISRALVDDLTHLCTRFTLRDPERIAEVTIEPMQGLGPPDVTSPAPGQYVLSFPVLHVPRLGDEFAWAYRRKCRYIQGTPPFRDGRTTLTGNVRGFAVALSVTFECEPPPLIWKESRHFLRFMGPPNPEDLVQPDESGTVYFPETRDTVPENAYGIAWLWP